MGDLLWLNQGTENRCGLRNRVKSRHTDFLLFDRESVRPLLAIELDDASHDRQSRIDCDEFVDSPDLT